MLVRPKREALKIFPGRQPRQMLASRYRMLGRSALFACAFVFGLLGCRSNEPTDLSVELRADYEVFAQRCSKCHSLSRPLNAGITENARWEKYVERMRLMPGRFAVACPQQPFAPAKKPSSPVTIPNKALEN